MTLNQFNIPFKIIEKEKDLSTESRAMLVVPGTLEHYSQLGVSAAVMEEAILPQQTYLHPSKGTNSFDFHKVSINQGRFKQIYTYPQDDHEALLYKLLREHGADVQ